MRYIWILLCLIALALPGQAQYNGRFGVDANWQPNMSSWSTQVPNDWVRLFDSCQSGGCTYWENLNSSYGHYNWTYLDSWLGSMKTAKTSHFVLTFARTPNWAASNTWGGCTVNWKEGGCRPPSSTSYVSTFITAEINHIKSWEISNGWTFSQIGFECWNEPNGNYWAGWATSSTSRTQLVNTCHALWSAVKAFGQSRFFVLSPPMQGCTSYNDLGTYLSIGGGNYADVIGFHYYCTPDVTNSVATPEGSSNYNYVPGNKSKMNTYGQGSKQLWNTEYGWGGGFENHLCNEDQQAAWVIRKNVIGIWQGVYMNLIYQVDQTGTAPTLWIPSGGHNDCGLSSGLKKAGLAWKTLRAYLTNNTITGCTTGTVWKCTVTGPNSFQGTIAWTTSGTSSMNFPYSSGHSLTDLGTSTFKSLNNPIGLSYSPVLLQNK